MGNVASGVGQEWASGTQTEARVEGSLSEPGRRAGLIVVGPEQRLPCGVFYLLTLLLLWKRMLCGGDPGSRVLDMHGEPQRALGESRLVFHSCLLKWNLLQETKYSGSGGLDI